jgi:ubiquitin-conjugating enzyme E2 variant
MSDAILLVLAQLLAGWLIADLFGGIAHWLEDRIFTPRTLVLGSIVAANRLHHAQPGAFLAKGFIERNRATWAATLAISLLWLVLIGPSLIWFAASMGGAASSIVHHQAHFAPGNRLVRILREIGLVQSGVHHAGHHRPDACRRYCVLTTLLNPILDGVGIWSTAERLLARCGVKTAAE